MTNPRHAPRRLVECSGDVRRADGHRAAYQFVRATLLSGYSVW